MPNPRSSVALIAAATAGLALSGCGSTSGSADDEAAAPDTLQQSTIDIGLTYTGGEAGEADSSKEPVKIGFVSQQGGATSFPEYEGAADAAVKFINGSLNGIDGHPIELVKCIVQSEEDGQKCASQFLADPDVHIVNWGLAVVGNETFYKTVAGKFPVVVSNAGGLADYSTPHVYELDGGGDAVLSAMAIAAEDAGAESVAIVSSSNPGGKFATANVLVPKLEDAGIATKVAYVDDTGSAPDFVSAVQASGAAEADLMMLIPPSGAQCVSTYNAMKQLAIKKDVVTTYSCYSDPVPESTGGGPEGWTMYGYAGNQRSVGEEATAFRNAMEAAGQSEYTFVGATPKSFTDLFAITKIGNQVGYDGLDAASFEAGIKALKAPLFMVPGDISCLHHPNPEYVGICGDTTAGSTYKDGKWQDTEPVKTVTFTE